MNGRKNDPGPGLREITAHPGRRNAEATQCHSPFEDFTHGHVTLFRLTASFQVEGEVEALDRGLWMVPIQPMDHARRVGISFQDASHSV